MPLRTGAILARRATEGNTFRSIRKFFAPACWQNRSISLHAKRATREGSWSGAAVIPNCGRVPSISRAMHAVEFLARIRGVRKRGVDRFRPRPSDCATANRAGATLANQFVPRWRRVGFHFSPQPCSASATTRYPRSCGAERSSEIRRIRRVTAPQRAGRSARHRRICGSPRWRLRRSNRGLETDRQTRSARCRETPVVALAGDRPRSAALCGRWPAHRGPPRRRTIVRPFRRIRDATSRWREIGACDRQIPRRAFSAAGAAAL